MKYLAASIVIAIAAAIYGLFSHGVYSYFMIYAFMIPLLGGALPHLFKAVRISDAQTSERALIKSEGIYKSAKKYNLKDAQLALVATLTVGSLMKGALDIYGTTNRLLMAYPIVAAVIAATILTMTVKNSNSRTYDFEN